MKKIFGLLTTLLLLNGCAESVALLGTSVGGASSGKILQSSLNSAISYGVKKQTGKSPLEHVLAYAEEKNPEKKKETCVSFVEKTRSEFCTIMKKQILLTNTALKNKSFEIVEKYSKIKDPISLKDSVQPEGKNFMSGFFQIEKSPRKLAIAFQNKIKNMEDSWPQSNKSRP